MAQEEQNDTIVLSPNGKLDTLNAPNFSKELNHALEQKPSRCIVDMSNVSFLSSSGLQALLLGAKHSKKEGISYAVSGMNELVKDVFVLSGFDRFIKVYKTKEEALQNL